MAKLDKEVRPINIELRAATPEEGGGMVLEGYPVVFEQETFIPDARGGFYEIIDKRAFDTADMSDICARYNHSENFFILARTRNKSLVCTPDEKGLFTHMDLIDTTTNVDIYKMARAGLLSQGSFAFTVAEDKKEVRDGKRYRRITKIGKCFDISVVDTPAYDGTAIYARSLDCAEAWGEPTEVEETGKAEVRNYALETLIKKYKRSKPKC